MESTTSRSDAASSPRHDGTGASPDTSYETRARPSDGGSLAHDDDYSNLWDSSPLGWIKAFLVMLLVLQAVSSSGHRRDARAPVLESVWPPANAAHGTDEGLRTSSERSSRCKRENSAQLPGTPACWTRPCLQSDQVALSEQDVTCSDNVGELAQCSGRRQHDDGVPPVPTSPSENFLSPLQTADENVVTSSLTMTDRDLGGEDNISLVEERLMTGSTDRGEDKTSVSGNRGIPDGTDGRVDEQTVLDASMGVEQPVAHDQIRCVPWSPIPGFRFLPTDLEIVLHYLKHRILNLELPEHNAVRDGLDVHRTDADEITLDINDGGKERLGFFFVHKDQAYTNGCWYPTPGGYWKLRRGQPAAIRHGGRVVAFKTSMDYVRGRAPHGRRTPWSMSEYALNARHHDLRNLAQPTMNSFVVCKVWKRTSIKVKKTPVLRRHGLKNRADRDLVPKPKVRRLVGGGVRGGILGKRKHPELF
ncbi:hypothetical protein EJB05_38842, partial [Eragrostis curvula]